MPNYFRLVNKQTGEADTFPAIDDKICAVLGIEPDPGIYYENWFDYLGLEFARGASWDEIRKIWGNLSDFAQIIDFLEKNYTVEAWYRAK